MPSIDRCRNRNVYWFQKLLTASERQESIVNEKKEIRLKNEEEFFRILKEVKSESRLQETDRYLQHGVTSVYRHSLAVAYFSCYLAERMHLKVRTREMIRGALLHDYFLYDWHEKSKDHRLHGFTHPARALKNAEQIFDLTDVEKDIIKRHMFPLTPIPPAYRESYLVCLADKICSSYETLHRDRVDWLLYHLQTHMASVK